MKRFGRFIGVLLIVIVALASVAPMVGAEGLEMRCQSDFACGG